MKLVGTWSTLRYLAQKYEVMYPKDPYDVYLVESLHGLVQDTFNAIFNFIEY
jgi:hypothetical protein